MRYVAFDIESAVTARNHSDMCAFGYAVADEDFNIIEEREITIRPKNVTKFLQQKLGVTMDDFRNAPVFRQVYREIKELLEYPDQMIFAHSAKSDLMFLGRECRKNSLKEPRISVYDTMIIYPEYTGAEKKALKDTGEWSGAEFVNHKASEDARACLYIPRKIFEIEGKEGFADMMKRSAHALVTMRDADVTLDLEDRRARSDRIFGAKYQSAVRPSGDSMKGITVSMSKNIVNKCPDIVEKVGNLVLMNSGRVTRSAGSADIQVVTGQVRDNKRLSSFSGRETVLMSDLEICDAINNKTVRSEMERLKRSARIGKQREM